MTALLICALRGVADDADLCAVLIDQESDANRGDHPLQNKTSNKVLDALFPVVCAR